MIKNSISYPFMKRIIEYYNQSCIVKFLNLFFEFLVRCFENSLLYQICTSNSFKTSKIHLYISKRKLKCSIGMFYENSILFKVILKIEGTIRIIFENNVLYNFFLDDEVSHGK